VTTAVRDPGNYRQGLVKLVPPWREKSIVDSERSWLLSELEMNVGDIEGFGIQTDRIGRRGDEFIIQTLYRYRLGAIGYFDVHLEVFRKAQKYSSSRTRLNPEQLAQRDVRDLLFARRNFKKSFVHEINCIDERRLGKRARSAGARGS
jgi:hypothetical protein